MNYRLEKDFLGEKKVPAEAYFGIHAQRGVENFSFSQKKPPLVFVRKIFEIKKACAKANLELGFLDKKKAVAIIQVCDEALKGKFDNEFPIDLFQAGSGTPTHMNANEVIANRATELLGGKKGEYIVHPNDDVNKGQSTNDVIPSAVRMANIEQLEALEESLEKLSKAFREKGKEFQGVLKAARTHLQDAVPVTLGQEFDCYAACTKKHLQKIMENKKHLFELAIGGNAVGTGLNTHPRFRRNVISCLNKQTGKKFLAAKNGLEQVQFFSDVFHAHSAVCGLAVDLVKICGDLKLLNSGPKTGFGEIVLPAVEPGSSIMPGKVNPSMVEAVTMASNQVISNQLSLTISCMTGQLELNTNMPIIANASIESAQLMNNSCLALAKTMKGIKANKEKCLENALKTPSIATALNPVIGYEKASEIVKESLQTNKTIKQTAIEKGYITKGQADKLLNPKNLTRPNLKA